MTEYTITLPLPPIQASPNKRFHWGAKARAVRLYREQCSYLIRQATQRKRAISGMVTIDLDFYLCRGLQAEGLYLPKDPDNAIASAKAAVDSLKDAGVIKGDSKQYVRLGEVRLHSRKHEHQNRTELVMKLSAANGDTG
jgi:Holliday junction resolvase RusA-like endonuclease